MTCKIKNWSTFQHFKDRRPPWIKLYRALLDDRQFHALSGDDAKTLFMLWLLASENFGKLPDLETVAFRLRKTEEEIKSIISRLSHWIESDDITAISSRHQLDTPERETESIPETESVPETEEERIKEDAEFQTAVDCWNDIAQKHKLPRCQTLTKQRRSALRQRIKEAGGIDGWKTACALVEQSPFLIGENDRGWRASFDFMLQAKSFTKIMEGAYERHANRKTGKSNYDDRLRNAAAMDFEKADIR